MSISTATFEDIPALYRLWEEAFGAGTEFLNLFFTKGFLLSQTYLYKTEGRIISALSVFRISHQGKKGAYIYGVCTAKEYRGKKYAASLLKKTEEILSGKGYEFFMLRPAEPGLFEYYKELGYSELIPINKEKLPLPSLPSFIPVKSLNADKLHALRKKRFGDGLIEWEPSSLEYIISYVINAGGDAVLFNNDTYLLGYPEEDHYVILETSEDKKNLSLNYIRGKYPELNSVIIFDRPTPSSKNTQPFVLYKGNLPKATYFNFTME